METLRVDALVNAPLVESSAARLAPSVPTARPASREVNSASGPETAEAPVKSSTDAGAAIAPPAGRTEEDRAQQRARLHEAAEELQSEFSALGNHSLKIEYSEEADRFIVSVIDSETQEVIRQIPPESLLEARRQMDQMRGLLFDDRS